MTGFPWDYDTDDDPQHGVFIASESMQKGGSLAPFYDLGNTLVHEVGTQASNTVQ